MSVGGRDGEEDREGHFVVCLALTWGRGERGDLAICSGGVRLGVFAFSARLLVVTGTHLSVLCIYGER